jgi:hypothetical protein
VGCILTSTLRQRLRGNKPSILDRIDSGNTPSAETKAYSKSLPLQCTRVLCSERSRGPRKSNRSLTPSHGPSRRPTCRSKLLNSARHFFDLDDSFLCARVYLAISLVMDPSQAEIPVEPPTASAADDSTLEVDVSLGCCSFTVEWRC